MFSRVSRVLINFQERALPIRAKMQWTTGVVDCNVISETFILGKEFLVHRNYMFHQLICNLSFINLDLVHSPKRTLALMHYNSCVKT